MRQTFLLFIQLSACNQMLFTFCGHGRATEDVIGANVNMKDGATKQLSVSGAGRVVSQTNINLSSLSF